MNIEERQHNGELKFTSLLCLQLVEERLNKEIYNLFLQSRDTLTTLAEQHKITWFYSTSHGLFLRGPAEAVKEASGYLKNNVFCDDCRRPSAAVSQASAYHDNNVIKVTRNEPTAAAVKQTSGNVNSKTVDRLRGRDNCPATRAVVLQPDGTMVAKVNKKKCLPGYKSHGTIVVTYDFPAGVQGVSCRCGYACQCVVKVHFVNKQSYFLTIGKKKSSQTSGLYPQSTCIELLFIIITNICKAQCLRDQSVHQCIYTLQ